MLSYELSLKIAELIIKLKSSIGLDSFSDINFYSGFMAQESTHCHCQLELEIKSPPIIPCQYIFNPADNWRLSDLNGRYILQVGFFKERDGPEEITIFNSNYTQGKIYKKKQVGELFRRFLDQFIIINLLAKRKGFLIHSAGLVWQDKGLCFIGRSGSGKSTLIKLFSQELEKEALLSDDRLAIRNYGDQWFAFGTPWYGEVPVASPNKAELKTIFFIRQSKKNYLKKLSYADAYQRLIICGLMPFWNKQSVLNVLHTFSILLRRIPTFEMGFLPDRSIVDLIKTAV